jgi:hypothetical protein
MKIVPTELKFVMFIAVISVAKFYCFSLQCVLDRVWQWPFNAFTLDTVTGGKRISR